MDPSIDAGRTPDESSRSRTGVKKRSAGYHGEGEAPTDEELRDAGIDPERNVSGESLPDAFE
jgi:hypothetical protein